MTDSDGHVQVPDKSFTHPRGYGTFTRKFRKYVIRKKGIGFPSRLFVEEAYIDQNGGVFVRSETDIIYKDYKFFIVETEIKY